MVKKNPAKSGIHGFLTQAFVKRFFFKDIAIKGRVLRY